MSPYAPYFACERGLENDLHWNSGGVRNVVRKDGYFVHGVDGTRWDLAGRLEYRQRTLNILALVVAVCLAAVALPFWGGREVVRGHQRSLLASLFLTILVPLGAIALGVGAAVLVDLFLQRLQGIESETAEPRVWVVAGIVGGAALVGYLVGLSQRGDRLHTFAVADLNEVFLRQRGIREVSEPNASHIDRWGDLLRLVDQSDFQITFLAVGRRSKRAYIRLNPDGRMLAYSGVMSQGDHWDGSDRLEAELDSSGRVPITHTERESLDVARPPYVVDHGTEAEDLFLASLAPPPTTSQKATRSPTRPMHWAIFWPLALLASAFSGLIALSLWVIFSPTAIRSHPLSLLVVVMPVAAAFFILYRRRKNRWSINAAQLSQ